MATITTTEAAYFSEPTPACGVLLSRRVHDQLFGKIPFVYIDGHQLDIANADADGLRAHASVIGTTGASPAASLPLLELATIPLSHFATILEVDSLLLSRYGNRQDVLRALLDVKVASLLDLFRYTIVNGDSAVAGEFDGLLKLADTFLTQTRANGGAGGAVQAGEIERMLSILRPQHGFANRYLVMHSEAFKHLRAGAYQNDVFFTQDATLGLLPTIGGAKVLIDNHLPLTEGPSTDWTSILGVVLEARSGVYGALPCVRRGGEVEVLGPVARESTETLTLALQMPAGVGAGNKGAIAKLDGVQY